jgi:hypothetical protein
MNFLSLCSCGFRTYNDLRSAAAVGAVYFIMCATAGGPPVSDDGLRGHDAVTLRIPVIMNGQSVPS